MKKLWRLYVGAISILFVVPFFIAMNSAIAAPPPGKEKGKCADPLAVKVKGKCECPERYHLNTQTGACQEILDFYPRCYPDATAANSCGSTRCACGQVWKGTSQGCVNVVDNQDPEMAECTKQCEADCVLCSAGQDFNPFTGKCEWPPEADLNNSGYPCPEGYVYYEFENSCLPRF